MRVLVYLVQNNDRYVSCEELIRTAWPVSRVGDQAVHNAVSKLRSALDDDSSDPVYIASERLRGYRVIAPVETMTLAPTPAIPKRSALRHRRMLGIALIVAAAFSLLFFFPRQETMWQALQRFLEKNPGNWVIEVKPSG